MSRVHYQFEVRLRPAFTLVEVTVSLAIIGIIMLAIASVMLLTARAMPGSGRPVDDTVEASIIAEQVASDLVFATRIIEASPTAIEVEVPDRDGDLSAETIRYEWGGKAGDPLQATWNGGTAESIVASVNQFGLSYNEASIVTNPDDVAEFVADQYNGAGGYTIYVQADKWPAQCFTPVLPDEAESWNLTRVRLQLASEGKSTGSFEVELREVDESGLPSDTVIASQTIEESRLSGSGWDWVDIPISGARELSTKLGYAIVLRHISGLEAAQFAVSSSVAGLGSDMLMKTEDKGSSWVPFPTSSGHFEVYGQVNGGKAEQAEYAGAISSIRLDLELGVGHSPGVVVTVPVLNSPEVGK